MLDRLLKKLEYPILQAPMAGVQDERLAIAVSQAGALGALPAAMLGDDDLYLALSRLRAGTSVPFLVNFFCHQEPVPDAYALRHWHGMLRPYYDELGLDASAISTVARRRPFCASHVSVLETCLPAMVSFHFGLPAPELLAKLRSLGVAVLSCATTVDEGRYLASRGVDGIIAQGLEAGGHRGMFLRSDLDGQTDTLSLVRQLVRETGIPVIAAGGVVDAASVSTAMNAGASAVQCGTAFLCSTEATTSSVHRLAIDQQMERGTRLTRLFTGRLARGVVNRLMHDLVDQEALAPAFPLAAQALAPLRAASEKVSRDDFSPLWCGSRADHCRSVPASEIIRSLATGL